MSKLPTKRMNDLYELTEELDETEDLVCRASVHLQEVAELVRRAEWAGNMTSNRASLDGITQELEGLTKLAGELSRELDARRRDELSWDDIEIAVTQKRR